MIPTTLSQGLKDKVTCPSKPAKSRPQPNTLAQEGLEGPVPKLWSRVTTQLLAVDHKLSLHGSTVIVKEVREVCRLAIGIATICPKGHSAQKASKPLQAHSEAIHA